MNTALGFLFYRLSGRRFVRWLNSLRHPGRLLGLVSCVAGFGLLFRFRDADFVQELVKSTPMGLVIALAGFVSLIRGLMQKGIPFDPPDMEYLCCGPFSHRAVLFYRLLPSYLSAVFFAILIYCLLGDGVRNPLLTSACVFLAHLLSIHLTIKVSLYAGSLSQSTLGKLRRALWAVGLVGIYLVIRTGVKGDGAPVSDHSSLRNIVAESGLWLTMDPSVLTRAILERPADSSLLLSALLIPTSSLVLIGAGFLLGSLVLWSASLLMAPQLALYEPSLRRPDGHEVRVFRKGESKTSSRLGLSARVVEWLVVRGFFNGALSVVWKNLLCARRSLPSLLVALAYTLVVVVPWLLLVLVMGQAGSYDEWAVNGAIPLTLAALPLLLQTALPFDFRLDGPRLAELKNLPFSSFQAVISVIAVPTLLCVGFQVFGLALLVPFTPFSLGTLIAMVFGFPAVAVGVNVVWNLQYLLFAVRKTSGVSKPEKRSTFGALFVLGLAFGVFFPSCWLLHQLVMEYGMPGPVAALISVSIQWVIDGFLLWGLARVYSMVREVRQEVRA
jgi:hypothetical protein